MAVNPSYALQFQRLLGRSSEPKKTRSTGTVTAVSPDSAGKIANATISTGGGLLSVPVPYGTNVYTGMAVSVINEGTPSNAQWRLYGTTAIPGGIQGGSIINHDGNTFAMFDSIWVRGDGTIIVGGDVDLDGDPTGPRVESNQYGYFGYDQYDRLSLAIYAANSEDNDAGDILLGPSEGSRISILPNDGTIEILRNGVTSLEFSADGNFIRDPLVIGNPVGARINLGEIDNKATFVLRDSNGVAMMVARTSDDDSVYVHIGNPPPESNSVWFDSSTGVLNVDGSVVMRSGSVSGRMDFASTGSFVITDPDDAMRYGVITPRGIYGYSVDGLGQQYLSSVDAWGPLVLETRPGSGVWKTWLAGEMMRGDPDYRHLRYERGASGRLGMFSGDMPIVYLDATGKAVFGDPSNETITIDTEGGIKFLNPPAPPSLDALEGGSVIYEDHMISVWENFNDARPVHRISAWLNTSSPPEHTLVLQAEPPANERARVLVSALGDYQANVRLRAIGGYDTVNQGTAQIDLWAYRGEGSTFNYSRIDLAASAVTIEPYTSATAFTGTIPDGLLMYTDGTWNPGSLGEGLYLYSNAAWHLIRGPHNATHKWGDATNYAQIDGDGILSFAGVARIQPRLGNETKTSDFTAATQTYYRVNTTSGAVTATLPTAVGISGRVYVFKLINGSNTFTIDPDGGETIDGASTWSTTTLYAKVTIISNNTNWEIIA